MSEVSHLRNRRSAAEAITGGGGRMGSIVDINIYPFFLFFFKNKNRTEYAAV